eukprot:295144_1
MDSLRDITQQCGQPTALSQLATNLTATNPSVLADASIYKQAPQITNNGPNAMGMQHVPTASNLMHQFNSSKPMHAVPMPLHAPQQIHTHKQEEQITAQMKQMQIQQPQQYQHMPQPMMMQMPQQMMMQPQPMMNMQYQMPPQVYQQPPVQQMQKQEPQIQKDEVNTNGTTDMKDEKEVQNELDGLRPTYRDVNRINQLLDESQLWSNQFKGWNDPNDVDNMNWDSYMQAINPDEANQDPIYEFAQTNHFVEEKDEHKHHDMNYFEEGIRLMNSGNLNEAILAFEACVKGEANRSEAWRYLGICHADNENENGAISAYLKCHSLDPYDLDTLLQLGVPYTNEIDPFRALNYLKQWIANHADYSALVEDKSGDVMGGYGGSKEEHKKVVFLFNRALQINAMDSDLHIVLGVLYNITSEFHIAENHFKKAIQSKPKDPSLWNKLGATQANGGKCEHAIRAYSKALQLKPNYVRALSNLGISFANQDMHKEACQSYLASLKLNNNADSVWDHLTMSLMHLNRGDLVELCKHKDVKYFKNHFDF